MEPYLKFSAETTSPSVDVFVFHGKLVIFLRPSLTLDRDFFFCHVLIYPAILQPVPLQCSSGVFDFPSSTSGLSDTEADSSSLNSSCLLSFPSRAAPLVQM